MTIDEAIADCVRQVPECAPGLPHVYHQGFGWCHQAGPTGGHGGGMPVSLEPETARALWFDAAYETLPNNFQFVIRRSGTRGDTTWCVWGQDDLEIWELKYQGPTKYHALAAACKLAKGIKP